MLSQQATFRQPRLIPQSLFFQCLGHGQAQPSQPILEEVIDATAVAVHLQADLPGIEQVPTAGGDAEFVLTAGQVLLRAAETAAAVVLDRAMRLADERPRRPVCQFHVLTIDEERNRQLSARRVADHDSVVVGRGAGQRWRRIGCERRSCRRGCRRIGRSDWR
jgi:hypothetical protein